jgi:hypothetical protein
MVQGLLDNMVYGYVLWCGLYQHHNSKAEPMIEIHHILVKITQL